jgi:hypothetical protein
MTRRLVKQATFAALATILPLGQRIYPQRIAQESTQFPACVYQVISSSVDISICGTDEAGDDIRVQIDVYDVFDGSLDILREQIIAAMSSITLCPVYRNSDNPVSFDSDARLFRCSLDFIFSLSNT